jgi:hypothetical protein
MSPGLINVGLVGHLDLSTMFLLHVNLKTSSP